MVDDLQITGLLKDFADGRKDALDRLIPLVYVELRVAQAWLHRELDRDSASA